MNEKPTEYTGRDLQCGAEFNPKVSLQDFLAVWIGWFLLIGVVLWFVFQTPAPHLEAQKQMPVMNYLQAQVDKYERCKRSGNMGSECP